MDTTLLQDAKSGKISRLIIIDAIRGLAVLLMLIYHLAWDFDSWQLLDINLESYFWWTLGRLSAVLFLLLVGVSFAISMQRKSHPQYYALLRITKLSLISLLITVVTYLFSPNEYITFGIIHCISASLVLLYITSRWLQARGTLFFGLILILLSILLSGLTVESPYWSFLGFTYLGYAALDYYPMLPWSGVPFLSFGLWNLTQQRYVTYLQGKESYIQKLFIVRILIFLGKHSLFIYLVHQPLFWGIYYILSVLRVKA